METGWGDTPVATPEASGVGVACLDRVVGAMAGSVGVESGKKEKDEEDGGSGGWVDGMRGVMRRCEWDV